MGSASKPTLVGTEARDQLSRLAPKLTRLLDEHLPQLTNDFFNMVKEGLKATVKIEYKTAKGRTRSKIMPDWGMRKWCMRIVQDLALQALDRGGASAVKTTELAGSLDVNNTHKVLEEYESMNEEEKLAQIARLERVVAIAGGGPATVIPSTVQQGLRRRPVIPG